MGRSSTSSYRGAEWHYRGTTSTGRCSLTYRRENLSLKRGRGSTSPYRGAQRRYRGTTSAGTASTLFSYRENLFL